MLTANKLRRESVREEEGHSILRELGAWGVGVWWLGLFVSPERGL